MSTAFNPSRGLVIVTVQVYGPDGDTVARLALDTGALGTLISPAILVTVGYDMSQAPEHVRIVTASRTERVPRLVLNQITALGQTQADVPTLCHALPAATQVDGVLGLDFIRGQRLVVDFRTGHVTLE
jgi:predicted aspartyl protease